MKGTISKIHPIKRSRNGNSFIRVEFKLETGSWAKTDICPDFRNYARWKPLLSVGKALNGLLVKKLGEIDADSYPTEIKPQNACKWVRNEDGTMSLICDPVEQSPLSPLPEEEKKMVQQKLI